MSTKVKLAIAGVLATVIVQGLTNQDPNGSLNWLNKLNYLVPLVTGAFAMYGYDLGSSKSKS